MNYLLLFILLLIGCHAHPRWCGSHMFANDTMMFLNTDGQSTVKTNLKFPSPIRIKMDYSTIDYNGNYSDDYVAKVKEALEEVISAFSKMLQITHPVNVLIKFDETQFRQCASYLRFNPEYKIGITNIDISIIPFIANSTILPENALAAAKSCFHETIYYRPVVGIVLINSQVDFFQINSKSHLKRLLFHELTHIFTFSQAYFFNLYSFAKHLKVKTINGLQRIFFAGPRVLEAAKKHFACDSIDGIQLEHQGGPGTVLSHWESKIMLGDYMNGYDFADMVISEITLALFEDSGWYEVKYYTGGLFRFGKGQGCAFLNDNCIINEESEFPKEFCTRSGETKCMTSNLGRGKCYLTHYIEDLPEEYRYFSNKKKGGYPPAEFCPVYYNNIEEGNYQLANSCNNGILIDNYEQRGEVMGENSMCFESTLSSGITPATTNGVCYEVECDNENKQYSIIIGDKKVICGENALTEHTVEKYVGTIICNDYDRVCTGTVFCNDMFECIQKESLPLSSSYLMRWKIRFTLLFMLICLL